jgi:hypothetical protein
MQGMIQHRRPSLLGGLGWQIIPPDQLDKFRMLHEGSTVPEGVVSQTMQTRELTVCDPTGEWIWAGTKVTESTDSDGKLVWEGVWRKRLSTETCGSFRFMQEEMLALGPIMIPSRATSFAFQWEGLLPEDWRAAINETIVKDCDTCLSDQMRPTAMGHIHGRLQRFLGADMPATMNKQFVSFDRGNVMTEAWVGANIEKINEAAGSDFTGTYDQFMRSGLWSADLVDALVAPRPDAPIFLAEHPILKKEYGIFMSVVRRDLSKAWDSTTNPYVLQLVWRPINKSWYSKIWDFVKRILVKVIKFTKDTFCALSNSQVLTEAAIKSGNPYAMAGGAGAATLSPLLCQPKTQVCADGSTIDVNAVCPVVPDTGYKKSPWPWVAGGIALLGVAAFLFTGPKPKKKPIPART